MSADMDTQRVEPRRGTRLGWIRAEAIEAVLPACLDAVGADLKTDDRRVQAALFMWRYAWHVAEPAIGCFVADRPLPDVAADNVVLRMDESGTVGAAAFISRRSDWAGSGAARRDWLHARLESHFTLTVDAVCAHAPLGARAQWALAADACATAFLEAGQRLGREVESCADAFAFLAMPGSPLRSRVSFFRLEEAGHRALFLRRRSCCLTHRVRGEDHCSSCPLLPESERDRRLRAELTVGGR